MKVLERPSSSVPVITIDGPSGSGKGTVSQMLATKIHWHFLDSGILYRALARFAEKNNINYDDTNRLEESALKLPVSFRSEETSEYILTRVYLDQEEITDIIRQTQYGEMASRIATNAKVRTALLERQRGFRTPPGLVADGRDMGTVVFPDAEVKFYLDADLKERARRRLLQLQRKGINASLKDVFFELQARDIRDKERTAAPLRPAQDAILIDSTHLSIQEVLHYVLQHVHQKIPEIF